MILTGASSACNIVTPESIKPSPTFTPTSTSIPVSQFDFSCWTIEPLQSGNSIRGSFVYAHYASPNSTVIDGFFYWDISSFRSVELKYNYTPKKNKPSYVSPDGETIALITDKQQLVIISQNDLRLFNLPNDSLSIQAFLTDGRIRLASANLNYERKDNYKENIGLSDVYYIFDPTTGETTENTVFLPNFETGHRESFTVQYSPDMKYVAYRSKHDIDESGFYIDRFTLYDLAKNEVVWVSPDRKENLVNSSGSVLGWQNANTLTGLYWNREDAHQINNYYSLSVNGIISQLTNFDRVDLGNYTQMSIWAEPPNWSPNGRYLISAGKQQGENEPGYSLYIWDNQEKAGYKPCLPNEKKISLPHLTSWSFDGSYVIVNLTFGAPSEYTSKSYLLDFTNEIVYEMPDDNNSRGFPNMYRNGFNVNLGWVNWETP